jgi:hypothetical protein
MAKRLDEFPPLSNRGTPSKYPWTEWLDGNVWELVPGKDFNCSITTMRSQFAIRARMRGLTFRTTFTGDRLVVQTIRTITQGE